IRLAERRTIRAVVVALVLGTSNPYWAFCALLLLLVAGAVDLLARRRLWGVLSAGLVAAILVASVTVNTLPSLVYRSHHGPNARAHFRLPQEADAYALKISHLLLPTPYHRSEWGEKIRNYY